ncbi:MAG TPA: AF1514 family protein [Phycisphaerae bacterium]|nr:AF1514 family protein [Phycisphaerae bacterium]
MRLLADAAAATLLGNATCLSWYDKSHNRQSPAHVECHDDGDKPGCVDYAVSRGAELLVTIGHGDFIFCYRPLGEFAGEAS